MNGEDDEVVMWVGGDPWTDAMEESYRGGLDGRTLEDHLTMVVASENIIE